MANKVLIFTKRVLPLSNTFVAAQGNNLPNFQPIYIGLRSNKSGINLIDGQSTCVQEQYEALPVISRLMLDGSFAPAADAFPDAANGNFPTLISCPASIA